MSTGWQGLLFAGLLGLAVRLPVAAAAGGVDHSDHTRHLQVQGEASSNQRRIVDIAIPEVRMTRHDGQRVTLRQAVDSEGPVFVNFLYTSCTTVCPVMAATFAGLQARLGDQVARVRMVSISIDPLQDTPTRLAEYRGRFKAGEDWHFLTGSLEASVFAQKAFDVYRGDKMNHPVASFFRPSPGSPWVRVEGFASPALLHAELAASEQNTAHGLHAGLHHGDHH